MARDIGQWGQFDPFRSGDAATFEWAGGNQQQFENMTPEEQAEFVGMLSPGSDNFLSGGLWDKDVLRDESPDAKKLREWVAKRNGGNGAPQSGTTPGAQPVNPYTQAATPDVYSEFGSSQWHQDPTTGQWSQTNNMSGPLSGGLRTIQDQWAEMLRTPMDDGSGARQQAIDSAYGQATSRLDPQWAKREEAQRTQLLNQGLTPGTEAYKNAMSEMGMQRNDAYTSAMNSAIGQGTSAGHTAFQDSMAARNNPLQQMGLLRGITQQQQPGPGLLNGFIAGKNNELGLAGQAQQGRNELIGAGLGLAGNVFTGLTS